MEANQRSHVVVVEDDINDAILLRHQLTKAEIDDYVVFKSNGKEALDFMLQEPVPPLAIFLDLHLPGMSGVDLFKRVRQEPRLKAVPVIVMTGFNDPHDTEACRKLGATAFLRKPIQLATFISTVAHLFPAKIRAD